MRVLFAIMTVIATVSQASAGGIDEVNAVAARVDSFYCTPTTGEAMVLLFAPAPDTPGGLLLYPQGYPSRKIGNVYTADLPDGSLSVNGQNFVAVTDDEIQSGVCKNFDAEMVAFISALAVVDPVALAGATGAALLDKSKSEIAELKGQVIDLKAKISEQVRQIQRNAEHARLYTQENTAKLVQENDQFWRSTKRENDKLKRRICELDPKTTFSVCELAK
jgi:hypothetical protein